MGLLGSKHPKYERNGVFQLSQIILSQELIFLSSYDYLQDFLVRKLFWLGSTISGIISICPLDYLFRLEVISSRKLNLFAYFSIKWILGFQCVSGTPESVSHSSSGIL